MAPATVTPSRHELADRQHLVSRVILGTAPLV